MSSEELILRAKEIVAKDNGYKAILGTEWETAMMFTHRTKKQLLLYEQVLDLIAQSLKFKIENNSETQKAK